ncbi:MAG: asparagine synthase (glutamine-hydrolyzing) [Methylococcaceae bacterium]|nr:asparagine synthase (glutamine-hydrolyzing) [Methylococcaceae bacterium]
MCGIAGICRWSGAPVETDRLDQMVQSLVHRGPDGFGLYINGPVGLGHRRLSIIDPNLGQQPMKNESESVVVSFNGEIYNYKELRTELLGLGYLFYTDSDTEVVLRAYEAWGEDCQHRFNGMWAFAIWDATNRKLLLSRDRLGEKPLLYAQDGDTFLFASEAKAFFAYGYPRQLDMEQLEIYLVLGYVPAPYSFFKGIRKLEAGRYLVVTDKGIVQRSHWDFPQFSESEMRTDSVAIHEEFEYLIKDSIRLRMRSDVPFGAFLSGGLDSASIVALMGEYSSDINTFTIGFEDKAFDERELARAVSKKFGTVHHEKIVGVPSFDDALTRTLWIYDEPFGDSSAIPSAQVCAFAAQHVKMVLTGDGGDEVLSGYPSYQAEKFGQYYQNVPAVVRRVIESGVAKLASVARGTPMYQLQRILGVLKATDTSFRDRLLTKSAWIDLCYLDEIMEGKGIARPIEDYLDEVLGACNFNDPFYKLMYFQHKISLPERMLTKVDRVSMAYSIECRAPFLDHRLVEMMAGVSKDIKMPGFERKHLLRNTVGKILPKELLTAPKRGFIPPLRSWINKESISQFADKDNFGKFNLNREALSTFAQLNGEGKRDFGNFLWMVLLLINSEN